MCPNYPVLCARKKIGTVLLGAIFSDYKERIDCHHRVRRHIKKETGFACLLFVQKHSASPGLAVSQFSGQPAVSARMWKSVQTLSPAAPWHTPAIP